MKYFDNLNKRIEKLNLNNIITNDIDAWEFYKDYNFLYNKMFICKSQELNFGPMGVKPKNYPIIFKPIINLFGMSRSFKIINNEIEYDNNIKDGLFWMDYLIGEQHCIDFVIVNGDIKFYSCLKSYKFTEGTFKYHESMPEYILPKNIELWIKNFLKNFTGCFNIEIINNIIIECHLRLNGDYNLYNDRFTIELNNLYNNNIWDLNYSIKKIYIIPVFIEKNMNIIESEDIITILHNYNCDNLIIDDINSIHQKETLSRYLIFDCNNLEKGLKAKNDILDLISMNNI